MFISPFAKINSKSQKELLYSLFYILLIVGVAMRYFDTHLTNDTVTNGILSFELAHSLDASIAILDSWSPLAKTYAGLSLGLDFLFLLIYSLFISLIIHMLNQRLWVGKATYKIGETLIWAMFLAAVFDCVENVCLIKLLIGSHKEYWSSIAFYFASVKFIIIGVSLLYIVYNSVLLFFKKSK